MNRIASSQGLLAGVVLVLIAVAAIMGAAAIKPAHDGGFGPGMVPLGAAVALLLLGLGQIAVAVMASGKTAPAAGSPMQFARIAGLALLAVTYYFALGKVGYLAATMLVTPLAFLLFGVRRPLTLILATALCPTLFYLAFFVGLAVYPPSADWFDLAEFQRLF